jgi:formate dehydrogenase subunit beta
MKGAILKNIGSIEKSILDLLKRGLEQGCFDTVLVPVKVPAGDSFAWVLLQDKALLKDANPLPPVMPVQGAKALSSVSRRGKINKTIAAIMRPCEIRAAIELSKLEQIDMENVVLVSVDCPGVLPLQDYLENPEKAMDKFDKILHSAQNDTGKDVQWGSESMRAVCQICDKSVGMNVDGHAESDLHIALLGKDMLVLAGTEKGKEVLQKLNMSADKSADNWNKLVDKVTETLTKKRKQAQSALAKKAIGLDQLLTVFGKCISCHNCQSVCPICYCRQCYFESENMSLPSDDYLIRAENQGTLRFLPDTLLFHVGRMTHMSLSCVGCGMCEDACPVSIKVAQVFSLVGSKSQEVFKYIPGSKEPLPLKVFKEDEFHEVEA